MGTVIENQRIVELPLNGRNYLQLAALTPGTTTNSQNSSVDNLRQGGTRSLFSLSVSGQRIFYNHYTLDGLENTDPNWNAYIFLPSLDALRPEVRNASQIAHPNDNRPIGESTAGKRPIGIPG